MSDELSPEIIDQIVFGMENQETSFLFDTVEGSIMECGSDEQPCDEARYIELPRWNSVMGFQLMERFVATLRNPLFREVLRGTLASGRGVFRKFKNALKDRPDIEALWFRFKEREMRRLVNEWYNEYRETIGLDRIAFDEEETDELVLSDFQLTEPEALPPERVRMLAEIDVAAYREMFPADPPSVVDLWYARSRRGATPSAKQVVTAETPEGELAGYLWFDEDSTSDGYRIGFVRQLTVIPEYRGLGIARALLDRYMKRCAEEGLDRLIIEFGVKAEGFSRVLEAVGFEVHSAAYTLDVYSWSVENGFG